SLAAKSDVPRADTLREIRGVRDTNSISAVEETTLKPGTTSSKEEEIRRDIELAFVAALQRMPEQEATESLMRHAVWSGLSDVRYAATEGLKSRPLHDFVPMLLDALATPIESSYHVDTFSNGSVHYTHVFEGEGPNAKFSLEFEDDA